MEPIRFPVATELDCRDATLTTDSLNKNVFYELGEEQNIEIVKRPGLDIAIQAQGVPFGVYHFGDKVFQFFEGSYIPAFFDVIYGNNTFLAIPSGNSNTTGAPLQVVLRSNDGIEWQVYPVEFPFFPNDNAKIYFLNGLFWIVPPLSSTNTVIYKSVNGTNWTTVDLGNLSFVSVTSFAHLAYGNNTYVLIGRANNTQNVIFTSSDGETWSSTLRTEANTFRPVFFNGTKFIRYAAFTSQTSDDGITWTSHSQTVGINTIFRAAINPNNGTIVAVSQGSTSIYYSTDNGVTWFRIIFGVSNIEGVCWDGTQFLSIANNGTVRSSPDGITWTTESIITTIPGEDWYAIAATSGKQVVVNQVSDTIAYADNLFTWTIEQPRIGISILVTRDENVNI